MPHLIKENSVPFASHATIARALRIRCCCSFANFTGSGDCNLWVHIPVSAVQVVCPKGLPVLPRAIGKYLNRFSSTSLNFKLKSSGVCDIGKTPSSHHGRVWKMNTRNQEKTWIVVNSSRFTVAEEERASARRAERAGDVNVHTLVFWAITMMKTKKVKSLGFVVILVQHRFGGAPGTEILEQRTGSVVGVASVDKEGLSFSIHYI
ncbi:hypothetical protein FB451DRAFT_1188292 [Mycena latifolia]|nr:hypothetical protein FB451DRAFT_1188292 [Mycena latifolia]